MGKFNIGSGCLRPNYRRARNLVLKIETVCGHLDEARRDPSNSFEYIEELKANINQLEHELSLTGVKSEYGL